MVVLWNTRESKLQVVKKWLAPHVYDFKRAQYLLKTQVFFGHISLALQKGKQNPNLVWVMSTITMLLWEMFTTMSSKTWSWLFLCKVTRSVIKLNKCLQRGDVTIVIIDEMSIFVCCGFRLQLRSMECSKVDTRWTYKMFNLKFVCLNLSPKLKNEAWNTWWKDIKVGVFANNWTWVFNFDVGFVFPRLITWHV
jgi:hypothetical protein